MASTNSPHVQFEFFWTFPLERIVRTEDESMNHVNLCKVWLTFYTGLRLFVVVRTVVRRVDGAPRPPRVCLVWLPQTETNRHPRQTLLFLDSVAAAALKPAENGEKQSRVSSTTS